MPELPDSTYDVVLDVHPSVAHVSTWISALGASIAFNDIDGDGLSNDMCFIESRSGEVIIAPIPGTTARYAPFAVTAAPLPFNHNIMVAIGCLVGDYNEDGWADLLVFYFGRAPVLFLQRHQQTLNDASFLRQELVAEPQDWYTATATQADLDGDGHIDLIFGNFFQDDTSMLDAKGSGRVEMQRSLARAQNGGYNYIFRWSGLDGEGETQRVRFEEVSGGLPESLTTAWTLAVGAADLDGDMRPELYFANDFAPDWLFHNQSQPGQIQLSLVQGTPDWRTPISKVLGHDSFKGMGVDFGDLNGDGYLDIFVSNNTAERSLEESHFVFVSTGQPTQFQAGVAPYTDQSEALGMSRSGWGWETRFGDFDNDGTLEGLQATGMVKGEINRWPEFQEWGMGNDQLIADPRFWPRLEPGDDLSGHEHNPFYVQAADGRFYDIAADLGIADPFVTRGIATADVDGDGDLDFAYANQWEPSFFFRNDSPQSGRFLGLHLLLPVDELPTNGLIDVQTRHPTSNFRGRPAIGAAATVHLPDGRQLVAQVDGGNGHAGSRSPDLHFGLGALADDAVLTVDMTWRDTNGRVHQESIRVTPGWHTVWLKGE